MKFSLVRTVSANETHLSLKTAEWFMERIQKDTKAGDVASFRQHILFHGVPADDGLDFYQSWSTVSTQVYPSVELAKRENGRLDITAFNGLIVLHVPDLLRRCDVEAVKEAAKMLPMTFAAMMGADGRSVEILVAAERKDGVTPITEPEMDLFCQTAYDTALGAYNGVLPKPVERQAASARSSFRMTLDEQPYYNPAPTPLKVSISPQPSSYEPLLPESEQREPDISLYAVYEQMFEQALGEVSSQTPSAPINLEAYVTEVARRLCALDVPEEEAFLHLHNHYVFNPAYSQDTFRAIVSAVYAEKKSDRHGDDESVSLSTRRLIRFLNTRYVYRYNKVMGYTEYRPNNTWMQDWSPCDENVINGMAIEARLANLDVREKDVRRYVHSNKIRPCDPISDYLARTSGKWDGKTDHIAMLARCVPCNIPQWEGWFRKWFLSMVAQWLLPTQEYGNSVVPLLISPQGDGKTTFCRNLLPKELSWGFHENLDVSEKRQTLQAMHNFLIINLDEFNQISPKLQEGFLKNIIQLPSVKIKRPYGKHVEEFKRYASFIATTNEGSVLADPTGSRRFICVQLTAPINTAYKPNYEALYGQASTIILEHREQWWFTPDEVQAIMEHNRNFEVVPVAVQYFHEYFEVADSEDEGQWMSPTAIYDSLRHHAGSGLKANGVSVFGRYLKNIPGLQQHRTASGMLYLVKQK